jgi:hypothetical protein
MFESIILVLPAVVWSYERVTVTGEGELRSVLQAADFLRPNTWGNTMRFQPTILELYLFEYKKLHTIESACRHVVASSI